MVLVRRKPVLFHDDPPHVHQPDAPVFLLQETGEIFSSYDSYANRMAFLRLNIFMCEVTGKSGLDYFQAAESERSESNVLHARFPEQLKAAVLRAVQWQIVGRLDHLVEAVFDRFKDRYFKGERVYVDVQGDKYVARIVKVFPPKNLKSINGASSTGPSKVKLKLSSSALSSSSTATPTPSSSTDPPPPAVISKYRPSPTQRVARSYPPHIPSPLNPQTTDIEQNPHSLGADLKLSLEESHRLDDPTAYYYSVQMISPSSSLSDPPPGEVEDESSFAGSEMEVTCTSLSRDRLGFNKALLKRFLKDALDRTNAIASPWVVKPELCERYGIEKEMPEEVRMGVEGVKKADHEKRKRVWEERDGHSNSNQSGAGGEKRRKVNGLDPGDKVKLELQRQQELEAMEAAAEEALRRAAAAKKRGVRYPTEDLDVKLSERDRKAGKPLTRPRPDKDVPFRASFETFLMTWDFLVTFGKVLGLSSFTLDEYERALRHQLVDPPCRLISEIHVALINVIQERPFDRHCAVVSLMELKTTADENGNTNTPHDKEDDWQVEIDELLAALADVGVSWEMGLPALVGDEKREGWEPTLVGVLKDYATTATFPRLRPILTALVYGPSPPLNDDSSSDAGSVVEPCHPTDRYPTLPPEDKLLIIQFLCDLAVGCRPVKSALEGAESELTDLRKQKIEVNRERKKLIEEQSQTNGTPTPLTTGNVSKIEGERTSPSSEMELDLDLDSSDRPPFDASSEVGSDYAANSSSRANSAPRKTNGDSHPNPKTIAHAKERALAREKAAEAKAAQASHRKIDDEVVKLDRRLEAIDREFRQLQGLGRSKALGRDRFYNRIWWFDGLGAGNLLGRSGDVCYGTGRVFLQGPSEIDKEVLRGHEDYDKIVEGRRVLEEGESGMLAPGEWACYSEPEQMEEFLLWLNVKGLREFYLERTLKLWWEYIIPGLRKRQADLAAGPQRFIEITTSRRTSRAKAEVAREGYMLWTNKRKLPLNK